jgi:hypothetical protein
MAAAMFQVSISISERTTLAGRMDAMRVWLDQQRFEPATFRYSLTLQAIDCRVDFAIETEATAFAEAFDGKVVSGSASAEMR